MEYISLQVSVRLVLTWICCPFLNIWVQKRRCELVTLLPVCFTLLWPPSLATPSRTEADSVCCFQKVLWPRNESMLLSMFSLNVFGIPVCRYWDMNWSFPGGSDHFYVYLSQLMCTPRVNRKKLNIRTFNYFLEFDIKRKQGLEILKHQMLR